MKKLILIFYTLVISTQTFSQNDNNCECVDYWNNQATVEFTNLLDSVASKNNPTFWGGYYLGKGILVLEAGKTLEGKFCLGVWKNGENIGFKTISDRPQMLTALYTYYIDYTSSDSSLTTLSNSKNNSPEFTNWMTALGIKSAVYMPTDFPDFPFKLSALKKVQLAVHELFHTEVQFPVWFGNNGYWPIWDKQPDRPSVNRCYDCSEKVNELTQKEINTLGEMIHSLLEGDSLSACRSGIEFIKTREKRYNLNDTVRVKQADNSFGKCETVESFMELEEGLADWASWTQLYENGTISDEIILKRYRTKQSNPYYSLGCMMFHAITLMSDTNSQEIIKEVVFSETIETGSIWQIFKRELDSYCQKSTNNKFKKN